MVIEEFGDMFGHPRLWPLYYREIIFCSYMNYVNRLKAVCFFYKNGIPIYYGLRLIHRCSMFTLTDDQAYKMTVLYWNIDREDHVGNIYRRRYSSYDLINDRLEFLNGHPLNEINIYNFRNTIYSNIDCLLNLIDLGLWT